MKVAITASEPSMDAPIDSRFGRAGYFLVVDIDSGGHEVIENSQNLQAAQGAGIQAARNVADSGVKTVITGNVGPKAFRTLATAGIEIYMVSGGTVREAVEQYQEGKLPRAEQENVQGHWV